MKCFHHDDLDGKCSGAIVKHHYPDCEMISMDYEKDFPFNTIQPEEKIWIVDFSLQKPGEFKKLCDIVGKENIVWIDHHQTSIKKIEKEGITDLKGHRADTIPSASILTWNFINAPETIPLPSALRAINTWDTWKHDDNPVILNFICGMGAYNTDPENPIWEKLLYTKKESLFETIRKKGSTIRSFTEISNKEYIEKFGFEVQFDSEEFKKYRGLACNVGNGNSKTFGSKIKEYDLVITFISNGEKYAVRMYTEKTYLKMNKIAVEYGGGGHPQAAGFECKKLPFSRKK